MDNEHSPIGIMDIDDLHETVAVAAAMRHSFFLPHFSGPAAPRIADHMFRFLRTYAVPSNVINIPIDPPKLHGLIVK